MTYYLFCVSSLVLVVAVVAGLLGKSTGAPTPLTGLAGAAVFGPVIVESPTSTLVMPNGPSDHQLAVGGYERTFRVYRPADLEGKVPLVVALHGSGGDGESMEEITGFDQLAEREKFAVLYPDGWNGSFNAGEGCCDEAGSENIDDLGAIDAMVDATLASLPIDIDRVYLTGFSSGGLMVHRVACSSNRYAAVASVGGGMLGDCHNPPPVSVLMVHGTADESVLYDGGSAGVDDTYDVPGAIALQDRWIGWNQCDPPTVTSSQDEPDLVWRVATCPSNREVALITLEDGEHVWPSDDGSTGPPLDATAEIWRFFCSHHR